MSARATALLACILLGSPSLSAAQSWAPIVVEQPDRQAQDALQVVRRIATVLRTEHHIDVLDSENAAQRFEERHSLQPVAMQDEDLQRHKRAIVQALDAAATAQNSEQWRKAYGLARQFSDLPQPIQDHVKWKLDRASDVFSFCTQSVDALLSDGREAAAREEMRKCIYADPGQKPNPRVEPERVLRLFEEVKAELSENQQASLVVDASGRDDSGSCKVAINGNARGTLPYKGEDLLPVTVRVQVHCRGLTGRIHVLKLAPGENSLVVDRHLEQVAFTRGYMALRYRDDRETGETQIRDAIAVAHILDTPTVLLVRRSALGQVSIIRLNAELGKVEADVTLDPTVSDDQVLSAARALAEKRSGTIVTAEELLARKQRRAAPPHLSGKALFAGTAAAVVGAAAIGVSWMHYAQRRDALDRFITGGNDATYTRYVDLGTYAMFGSAYGNALLSVSVATLLPAQDGVPWWAIGVGAVGLGVAATGAYLWSDGEPCLGHDCDTELTDPRLGQLVLMHGAPLLAVPLTYGLRALLDSDQVQTRAELSARGGSLGVQGSF